MTIWYIVVSLAVAHFVVGIARMLYTNRAGGQACQWWVLISVPTYLPIKFMMSDTQS